MMRSINSRRWVTGVSVFILLLCQTMAAALTYAAAIPAQPAAMDAAAPCHTSQNVYGDSSTLPPNSCHERCPSRDATFETTKINIPAAAGVALPTYIIDPLPGNARRIAPYQHIAANAAPPPPLRLVYCRLLN